MTNQNMTNKYLHVLVDGKPALEFDRDKAVPEHQLQYLDDMDARMNAGIQLSSDFIKEPNSLQRCQFVANALVKLLTDEHYSQASAMCTYLAKRLPDLQQVQCKNDKDKKLSIEFVFDRSLEKAQQEQTIQFQTLN